MLDEKQSDSLAELIWTDPEFFHTEILGYKPWEKQLEISHAITHHRNVAIRSCNGAGKTFHIAREALRFLYSFPNATVINTAPTWTQIENQFWRYFRDAHKNALVPLGGKLLKTELTLSDGWFAKGIANNPDSVASFQGWHAENIMMIFDEASGIPPVIWEAAVGAMSGGTTVRFLVVGNPNSNSGPFYNAFKDPTFHKVKISAFDIPNVIDKRPVIPGLTDHHFVEEVAARYGVNSNAYKVRVLGEFPDQASDTLISLDLIENAFNADRELQNQADEIIGLDPARFGDDDSAFVHRKGNTAKVLEVVNGNDTMELAGKSVQYLREHKGARLFIDIIGLGAGIYDRLKELPEVRSRVYGVNSASKARNETEFINIRIESWSNVRDWLRDAILEKHECFYELAQPRYKLTSNGKMQLEGKEEMKKRGVASPNCFVAGTLIATPYGDVPIEQLAVGDVVTTPMGPRRVIKHWTSETDAIATATFSNGTALTGTPSHGIFTWDRGFVALDALVLSNTTESIHSLWKWKIRNLLFTMDKSTGFSTRVDTIAAAGKISPSDFYTGIFGISILAQYLTDITSITKTAIGKTIVLKILSASRVVSTHVNTWLRGTALRRPVLTNVQVYSVEPTKVYNLTLEADNVYYANGVLVKNCGDALALTLSRATEGDNLGVVWI